ncbi:alpha/beta fold hydrolase [Kribbella sp.]|uniref:alpha/beta fold hydrolase n=1 Tax=Kribbella sp. TaxID=1871183 RepID=UPI0039C93ACB
MGFSTGGRAAMQFVDTHPEQVRRLVLASTSAYRLADAAPYLADWPEYQRRQRIDDEANGALRNSTVFVWDLDRARSRPQRTASSPQRGPHVPLRTTRDLVRPHPPVPRRLTLGSSVECQSVEEVVLMRRSCAVPPRNHRRL